MDIDDKRDTFFITKGKIVFRKVKNTLHFIISIFGSIQFD